MSNIRFQGKQSGQIWEIPDWSDERNIVWRNGEEVKIEKKHWELLRYFAENPRRPINRDELIKKVWGQHVSVGDSAVEKCVSGLREKLGDSPNRSWCLRTIRGGGYEFIAAINRQNTWAARVARASEGLWTKLDVSNNGIGEVGAAELAKLTHLRSLNASNNDIGDLGARELAKLTHLTSLAVSDNGISEVGAGELAKLTHLTSLNIRGNSIGWSGARELARLTRLKSLKVGGNRLSDAGALELAKLTNLTSLNIRDNEIGEAGARAILEAWSTSETRLRRQYLNLRGHGDLSAILPPEALNTTDAQAILAAYDRFRKSGAAHTLRPLNEAKLLIVGNEAAGKTSLVRYLVHNEPRIESEGPTRGAAIHEKIEIEAWTPEASGVMLNIWDFGGQEIMHGTHQYFLTRRSLYLLVLDARAEDDQSVFKWLRTIRNRGGESPVIIVINKCDGDRRGPRLDEEQIRTDYPAVVAIARTSCNPGNEAAASVQALRELIAATLVTNDRLKHIRDPFPGSYLRVKQELAGLARERRILNRGDFERICEHGDPADAITSPAEQRGLLGILHDLGVVVAYGFERDVTASLREVTLLDPNWLTGGIYALLTSALIAKQSGALFRLQMRSLLDPKIYSASTHEFILDMMQDRDLGLCFRLPGDAAEESYLIPEALREKGPDYDAWQADSLRFRFQYRLLPRALMPRFIVESHRNRTQHETRWLFGVVLEAAGCKVLVKADRDEKRIDILVAGPPPRRRGALNIVLNDLRYVHSLNQGLGEEARVPLPDKPEASVAYDNLLAYEDNPDFGPHYKLLPEGAKRAYTVSELLDGVRIEVTPSRMQRQIPQEP